MDPGKRGDAIGFVFAVAQAGGIVQLVFPVVGIGIVGDLVVVGAELAHETQLVAGFWLKMSEVKPP